MTPAIGALIALAVAALAWLARALHVRAVITAEQRGRVTELDRQRAAAEQAAARAREQAGAAEAAGERSADAAERSPGDGAVTADEVAAWVRPPEGPAS